MRSESNMKQIQTCKLELLFAQVIKLTVSDKRNIAQHLYDIVSVKKQNTYYSQQAIPCFLIINLPETRWYVLLLLIFC
jgi:hypothetical protein